MASVSNVNICDLLFVLDKIKKKLKLQRRYFIDLQSTNTVTFKINVTQIEPRPPIEVD